VSPRPLPYREVRRKLTAAGFEEASQRGSHVKFVKDTPEGLRTVVVPRHREVAGGTLRSILRQAGITLDDFEQL
jgi:predicted RNA binding protein YcfA (HicA-like mRNA interferase family)